MTVIFQKQKRTKRKKSWKETSLQSAHRKVVLHQKSKGESKLQFFFALLKSAPTNPWTGFVPWITRGMVTGKSNCGFVTLLLDLYCFSALKVDEPEIYGKSG